MNESLGVFEGQYETAEKITEACIDAIRNGEVELYTETPGLTFSGVHCTLSTNAWGFGGEIWKIGEDNSIWIRVSYDTLGGEDRLRNGIMDAVVHELMHGHIFRNRMERDEPLFDTGWFHGACVGIVNDQSAPEELYRFAYSVYTSYYQESQAIVSQSLGQIRVAMDGGSNMKDAILNCAAYDIYNGNIRICERILGKADDWVEQHISGPFKQYSGVPTEAEQVKRECRKCVRRAEKTIKDICRAAILKEKLVERNLSANIDSM